METVTFYSYKGGVGRTLVVANVATYLARLGRKVFALDFDLGAPGLHYKLPLGDAMAPPETRRGLVDLLLDFDTEGRLPDSLADYVVRLDSPEGSPGGICLMPAGSAPHPSHWRKLSRINWHELFYSDGARGVPLFLELKERIRAEYAPDFLLIDSQAGITEIGGVATTLLPEKVVCLFLRNPENLEGAREVLRSIRRMPRITRRQPVEMLAVLARIPAGDTADGEQQILLEVREFLNAEAPELSDTLDLPEVLVLHSEPELELAEALRAGGKQTPEESRLLRDYLRLFSHLMPEEVVGPPME